MPRPTYSRNTFQDLLDQLSDLASRLSVVESAPPGGVSSVFSRTGTVTAATNDYTWAQINKATSSIADITTKSHTALSDIGSNTHAQIDTHVASTSNPHSVTKTQVGLGSVTNDAQLKAADLDTDGTLTANSDTKVPSQKAVKTYADTKQTLDSDLTTLAGLTATTDNFIVSVSNAWSSRTPSQVRATLGLVIGTNVQAWGANLDTWSGKTAPSGTVVGNSDTQILTNKDLTSGTNTFPTFNQNTSGSAATLTIPRAIYGNNFDGSVALTQVIASTYGGTGNGFAKFSGPASSEKTFSLPNASSTILTSNDLVTVAQGGSGAGTLTGILKGNGTSAFTAVTAPSGAIVGDTDTQTLTGKTIDGDNNTLSDIGRGSLKFSGAQAYNSAPQSIAPGGGVATFDSEAYDTDGYHDTSSATSRMTVPATGKYRVSVNLGFAANATGRRGARFQVNGATGYWGYTLSPTNASGSWLGHTSAYLDLTAGDYVEVFAFQESGGNLNTLDDDLTGTGAGACRFSIERLS